MNAVLSAHRAVLIGTDDTFDIRGRGTNGLSDSLLERAVHAFEYVAQLESLSTKYVFTGGTAAQLLIPTGLGRLSKDVDILAPGTDEDTWRANCQRVAAKFDGEVYSAREEARDHGGLRIRLIHFDIAFPSDLRENASDISLDVWIPDCVVPTQRAALASAVYRPKVEMQVTTPTREALIALKLATLGPSTMGIARTHAGFELAVMKQVFDLDRLLQAPITAGDVADIYATLHQEQSGYRDNPCAADELAEDGLYLLRVLSAPTNRFKNDEQWTSDHGLLSNARTRLEGYVAREELDRPRLLLAAARVSLLSRLVVKVLRKQLSRDEASERWNGHVARIGVELQDERSVDAAITRLSKVPFDERKHFQAREYPGAAGPEAVLYWDATYVE